MQSVTMFLKKKIKDLLEFRLNIAELLTATSKISQFLMTPAMNRLIIVQNIITHQAECHVRIKDTME